ncbi:hypothetical protein ACTXT7_017496 [Hymenolepis weldensis]
MYNGIGLPTPRGSGTNGYVQRNLAFLTTYKDKINYKTDEEVKHTDAVPFKEPNKEILMHEKKRKVEVKCLELQMQMEDQGYTEEEVQSKVSALRKDLLSKLTDDVTPKRMDEVFKTRPTIIPEVNRLLPKGTHETAAVTILKNNVFKNALGIGDDYEVGTAMQRAEERHRQAEEAKALFEAQQKLKTLKSSSSEEESASDGDEKRKKKRRHKSKKSHKKSHHKKHKRSRKHSSSSEESGSSDSESEEDEVKERKRKHRKHRQRDDKV